MGINCVVAQVNREPLRACNAADFQQEDGSGSFFPRLGSESTPPHPSTEFYFKDFCPMVFRNLREKAGISVGDYVQWLCGDAALREMSSPGKSGAGFFISNNDKLLVRSPQLQVSLFARRDQSPPPANAAAYTRPRENGKSCAAKLLLASALVMNLSQQGTLKQHLQM